MKVLLALDGMDLRESEAVLVGPFARGRLELPGRTGRWIAVIGEFQGGEWTVLEKVPMAERLFLELDPHRATCLVLVCRPEHEQRWSALLTVLKKGTGTATSCVRSPIKPLLVAEPVPFFSRLMRHPERIAGY